MIRFFSLLLVFFLASCNTEKFAERVVQDKIHRIDFILEYDVGPPLSPSEDRIFVNTAKGRELIFEGYDAPKIDIKPLREGIVIVEYCGGSIQKVSSFLSNSDASRETVVVKVQPVVIANVSVGGVMFCPE